MVISEKFMGKTVILGVKVCVLSDQGGVNCNLGTRWSFDKKAKGIIIICNIRRGVLSGESGVNSDWIS